LGLFFPVPVAVRENNLKTSMKYRFDKSRPLKRNPGARVDVMIHFKKPFRREPQYFWGYCIPSRIVTLSYLHGN